MSLIRCPYCEHANSEGARFCSACGGALHLAPCPHCGAVLDVTNTTVCYQCHRPVPGQGTYDLTPPPPAVEPETPSSAPAIERAAPFAAPGDEKPPASAAPATEQPSEPAMPAARNVHAFTPAARKQAPAPATPAAEQAPATPSPVPDQARAVAALRAYWTPTTPSPAAEKTPEPAMPAAQPAPAAKETPAISPRRVKQDYGDLWVVDEPASAAAEHAPAGVSPPAGPAASPSAQASGSSPRRRGPLIAAAAGIVVAIAMLAYHNRSDSPATGPQSPAAKSEASERSAPANTGVIGRTQPAEAPTAPVAPPQAAVEPPKPPLEPPKAAVEAKAAAAPLKAEKSKVITRLPEAAPASPLDARPRGAAAPLRHGATPAEPLDANAAAAPTSPQAARRTRSGSQVCTEASAALGLCVMKPAPKGKPSASAQAATTREQAIEAGRAAAGQQPVPSQTCTEAVAALGLCAPKPIPRKE